MLSTDSYINSPLEIEKELLSCFSREDKLIIFDIGACEGEDSVRYSKLFPYAEIYSFEPVPANLAKASGNLQKYNARNVRLISEALSDNTGTALFHVSSGSPGHTQNDSSWDYGNKSSSLLAPSDEMSKHHQWLMFQHRIEVTTNTLANFCAQSGISQIDFIHMDVQGAELMVLTGAGDMMRNIKVIWMEVENVALYAGQPLKTDVERFMISKGFYKIKDTVTSISGDQFYINKNFFPAPDKMLSTHTTFIQQVKHAFKQVFK